MNGFSTLFHTNLAGRCIFLLCAFSHFFFKHNFAACSVKLKLFNKMFTSILALFFLLRIANKSRFYAPSSTTSVLFRSIQVIKKANNPHHGLL